MNNFHRIRNAGPARRLHRWFCQLPFLSVITLFVLVLNATNAHAQSENMRGSTSRADRLTAIRSIPMHKLTKQAQKKLSSVMNSPSIYRRLPVTTIQADPDLQTFLVRYPEIVVNIWQIMGVTKMSTKRISDFLLATNDGVGTTSRADLVYGSAGIHVYYCEGSYDGAMLLRPVKGRCVVILKTDYFVARDGKTYSKNRLDIFLKIDNMAASVVAKTVHPLVGSTADHNFVESMKFLENLSRTTETNGTGVQRLAQRLKGVSYPVRQRFIEIAGAVYAKSNGVNLQQTQRTHPNYDSRYQHSGAQHSTRVAQNPQFSEPARKLPGVRRTISSGDNNDKRQMKSVLIRNR